MDQPARSPLVRSFERHLRALNRSERTIETYLISLRQADAFLHAHGTNLEAATRADLEAFLADVLARGRAPGTAATYHKVLKLLYAWLVEEGEIPTDPMAKLRPPLVPDKPVPIVPADALKRLFAVCAGSSFEARRDTALLTLLLDTGARRAEMTGITVDDVDLDLDVLVVLGKGRRERTLPFGRRAGEALDRYLRARTRHKHSDLPWLWLGQKGRLTDIGLRMMLRRRGAQIGLPGLHAHQLRHTFAHEWLAQGGNEAGLRGHSGTGVRVTVRGPRRYREAGCSPAGRRPASRRRRTARSPGHSGSVAAGTRLARRSTAPPSTGGGPAESTTPPHDGRCGP
jgi:site-specific recombinase XerD